MADERERPSDADGSRGGDGPTGDGAGRASVDAGAGDRPVAAAAELLALTPAERDDRGVTDDELRAAFLTVLRQGGPEAKDLRDVDLPELSLDYQVIEGVDNTPVDLRGATIGGLSAEEATLRLPLRLDGATLGAFACAGARVEGDVTCEDATVTGEIDAFEATFEGDFEATGATFEAAVRFDETVFDDDVSFDDATFEAAVSCRGAEFHGDSNLFDDNASFRGAVFGAGIDARQAEFGFARFEAATVAGPADFEEVTFTGDAAFPDVDFEGAADFDEADFEADTDFAGTTFAGECAFRGAEFEGEARALEADATFAGVVFAEGADFRRAKFRHLDATGAAFEGRAMFQEAEFHDDVDFAGVTFEGEADFDETRFHGDADLSGTRFAGTCVFRGAEFHGDANHLEDGASFADARFEAAVDFDDAWFTSADFTGTAFAGTADFSGTEFDRLDCEATPIKATGLLDFAGAKVRRGTLVQPGSGWMHYDFTNASLGDLALDAVRESDRTELLDYFRFCNTEFNEFDGLAFDFSDHADYLDRNDWVLHRFDENVGSDHAYALDLTPGVVETTYLKAKTAASAAGDMKPAGEFRVKRQQFARRKNLAIARDPDAATSARVRNLSRAAENAFLGVTCGHGMRLLRIATVFLVMPMFVALLYAFGGQAFLTGAGQLDSLSALATPEGRATFFRNVHFSYISYTTIGYGNIGPQGAFARILAGTEAYLSTILAALVIYALVKRSEL